MRVNTVKAIKKLQKSVFDPSAAHASITCERETCLYRVCVLEYYLHLKYGLDGASLKYLQASMAVKHLQSSKIYL